MNPEPEAPPETLVRMYKYRAFPPKSGRAAFAQAIALKRAMWADLCAMHPPFAEKMAEARKAKDQDALSALRRDRTAAIADIRRGYAECGLAWGDYNAVVFQFEGAVRASAARGAMPAAHDGALGEAVVRQLMGTVRPHHLLSRNDVCIEYLEPNERERTRKPGSHRSKWRTARMDFSIRTDRNVEGPASMVLEFILRRPLPANARLVEVRILRETRPIIRQDGSAGEREQWYVCFAARIERPQRAGDRAIGVALDWSGAGDDGTHALVIADDSGRSRDIVFGEDHLAAWARSKEMFADADAEPDAALAAAKRNEALIYRRRLEVERRLRHRTLAAQIARDGDIVGIQKIWLAEKGVKNFTAPAAFRLALKHAVENAGGRIVEVKAAKKDFAGSAKKLAHHLRIEAKAAILAGQNDDFSEAAE
jgi:hypothetical protein